MIAFLSWYLLVSLVGLVTFPLAFRLLPGLPGRGYAFSRILGLLLWGYAHWLLSSLGFLPNDLGGILFVLLLLIGAGAWTWKRLEAGALRAWWDERRRMVWTVEVLFLAAFGLWTLVRAANPAIFGTEKPMELAFINAILRSPAYPPNDPWLAGYAISYYYFGYAQMAMLARLTNVAAGVAFNLAVAVVFALSALGAYGVLYDLLAATRRPQEKSPSRRGTSEVRSLRNWLAALLGPFLALLLGNAEGFLELLHARGLFWRPDGSGGLTSSFWTWLDMQELSRPPAQPFRWLPRDFGTGSWWWWRASRVVQDYDLAGGWREVIDEFPFFSFLLADLHPHVLAIPCAFLGVALALNLFLGGAGGQMRLGRLRLWLSGRAFLLAAVALGGLAFLNTWDFPIYVALFCGTYVLVRVRQAGWGWARLGDFLALGLALGVAGFLLYLPFYIGFASQAGGLLPNLVYPTRGAHLWVMFGLFFLPLLAYLFFLWRQEPDRGRLLRGLWVALGVGVGGFLLAVLLGVAIVSLPLLGNLSLPGAAGFSFAEIQNFYLDSIAARGQVGTLFQQALIRRLVAPGGWLTLGALLALTLGLLWPRAERVDHDGSSGQAGTPAITPFVLLLILFATLLVLGPEFFYLRDQFGWRINTIFKFYYQAWLLWSVAVAYGVLSLLRQLGGRQLALARLGFLMLLIVGLAYPVFSLWDKTRGFRPPEGLALDGTRQGHYLNPDDAAAVDWLNQAPFGYLVEAVGDSYSQYARISAHTGLPTLLGWPGHESQWRGGAREMGTRQGDIEHLYSTRDWTEARRVLERYNVRYVYIGPLERATYGVSEVKFQRFMQPVYRQGAVTIYELP